MCFFLTAGVRPENPNLLEPFREAGFQIQRSSNRDVLSALGPGVAAFYVTNGMCSCDFYSSPKAQRDRLRSKYKRKGWPAAKIERALRDHDRATKGSAREAFVEAFCRVAGSANQACVFGHWYSGLIDSEDLPAPRRSQLSVVEYQARGGVFPEDEIIVVEGNA